MSVRICTLGIDQFDIKKIRPIKNNPEYINKPIGGLWGSTFLKDLDYRSDWERWCVNHDYRLDNLFDCMTYELNDNAKILEIASYDHFRELMRKYAPIMTSINGQQYGLNFERIAEEYDVIHHNGYIFDKFNWNWNDPRLEGWITETYIIMNLDAINMQSIRYNKEIYK